jgi:hypothetical protein
MVMDETFRRIPPIQPACGSLVDRLSRRDAGCARLGAVLILRVPDPSRFFEGSEGLRLYLQWTGSLRTSRLVLARGEH